MKTVLLTALAVCAATFSMAAERPSSEAAKQVLDYYYAGGEDVAPVLVDYKICEDIVREGDEKNNCTVELDPSNITVDTPVYLWMNFMVPSDNGNKLLLQVNNKGLTRSTHDISIAHSIRYRSYKKLKFNKAGAWDVKLYLETKDDVEVLTSVSINAVDAL